MSTWQFTGSIEQLRDLFDYDPDTGSLTWRARDERYVALTHIERWNSRCAGKAAETDDHHGYYQTNVNGKSYRTHRICYALARGINLCDVPPEIDHENGDGQDNRKNNMRGSTRRTNAKNGRIRTRNTSGLKGVSWDKQSNSWRAAIKADGHYFDRRGFVTKEAAHAWYIDKAKQLHQEFGCGNVNGILA